MFDLGLQAPGLTLLLLTGDLSLVRHVGLGKILLPPGGVYLFIVVYVDVRSWS